jgi:ankyrin repeat protein
MAQLPGHPDLDHLRRQARDLLRAVRVGDADAVRRLGPVSAQPTLALAQLAIAREYGFESWPKLKAEVEVRAFARAEAAEAFCRASVNDWTGRAVRMLAESPELAGFDFATAVVLGDATRVQLELERDPSLATRHDPRSGWTALHLVAGSRWHSLDPVRADGLVVVGLLLLDAGAGVGVQTAGLRRRGGGRTALRCATGSASTGVGNEPMMRLLLDHGAVVEDHDLYLVAFGRDDHRCLRLLLEHTRRPAEVAMAFAAAVSIDDAEAVRLLLDAGADPHRYRNDENQPASAVFEAVSADCSSDLVELLLTHGADPNGKGDDGRSAYQAATAQGRADLRELLGRYGATNDASDIDRLQLACLKGDRPEAERLLLAATSGMEARLGDLLGRALARAAEAGNVPALALSLDLGCPIDGVTGDDGSTALHAAAYAGSAAAVRLLLDRGADVDARDANWSSTPLEWAVVGSGERPRHNPVADWPATVETLLEAGASTDEITLSPDDPKPPSPEVARLLRSYGIGGESSDNRLA